MSEDYSAQQQIASWNPARGVWEIPMVNILCEHWGLFSETFPTSGMMRDGKLFPLPPLAHHTDENEFSLLPTVTAQAAKHGSTPDTNANSFGQNLWDVSVLFPAQKLLPTPMASMKGAAKSEIDKGNPRARLEVEVFLPKTWGKFEPAIRQWETITGNPAPPPTIPDGKDGQHRLNPQFAEWMMGLQPGHITNCDITRNEQLKACGNGVVPQQATLALTQLLKGLTL